ncbi:MAG TPA: S53 family peptidase [Thermomicrobiaceae bacterium]|nr:S53 family peptidase [Thermomicrobiaceae bacterium]
MRRGIKRPALLLWALVLLLSLGITPAAAAPSGRAKLAGSVPPWATSANFKSSSNTTDYVGFRVYLGWRGGDQAAALARAVSDPSSPSYGHYLNPAQFRQQFAPSSGDTNSVRSWLKSQGFSVVYTPQNNHYISAEGTVGQVEAAFGVQLNQYTVDGTTLRAPAGELSIPAALAGTVDAIIGIDQTQTLTHPNTIVADAPPSAGFRNAPPCSTYWAQKIATDLPTAYGKAQPYAPCGYTPAQLQGAYGIAGAIASGNDGSGQTVAIIDAYASPTIVQDVNQYSADHGLPQMGASQFSQVVAPGTYRRPENPRQDPQGWYGEETLDVEAVHSMAPGANIVYVGAPNNFSDLDAALNHVVDRDLAQIVTNSYGFPTELLPPGYVKPYNDTLIQAAIQGIGVYFSSGDDGDEVANIGFRSVDWPAASPWVTAVGGTSLAVGASNNYLFETGWGTDTTTLSSTCNCWKPNPPGTFLYGSGGGTSRIFAQPWYQVGVVPSAIANYFGPAGRAVPDVAMVGDPNTGMLVGQTQTFSDGTYYDTYRIGGTSLASPLFAGVMALADQKAGHAHGFANPALYSAAGTAAYHDVVNPPAKVAVVRVDYVNSENADNGLRTSLRTMNQTGTLHTRPGYDDVTGVGTPNGSKFLAALGH